MNFKSTILLFITFASFITNAQNMTPEEVVQKQLEAYNQRDIKSFMAVIDPEIKVHDFATAKKTMQGYEACKAFYSKLFEHSPNLHSTILTRTVFGNKVVDHESITGRNGNDEVLELVLIYEVENAKIHKITVLRKEE